MFISKKNCLSFILIGLVSLGLVNKSLSLFKRTTEQNNFGTYSIYTSKNDDMGIYARVDIDDTYRRYVISSISHSSNFLSNDCLEIGNIKICDADLLNVKYELLFASTIVLLSIDSSFHSDKYFFLN